MQDTNFSIISNIINNNYSTVSNIKIQRFGPKLNMIQHNQPHTGILESTSTKNFVSENFKEIQCLECGENYVETFEQKHMIQCQDSFQPVECEYCKEPIIKRFMNDHWAECIEKVYYMLRKHKNSVIVSSFYPGKKECCICLMDISVSQPKSVLTCAHMFHNSCIQIWLQRKQCCPICQTDVEY